MTQSTVNDPNKDNFGSDELNKIVAKLQSCSNPRIRYEYLLYLAKHLPSLPLESLNESSKVRGCISQVYVIGQLKNGKLFWEGYSDALITKGMLSFLIKGLNNLTPKEVLNIDPNFIPATGLSNSLTPSRVNGFMNIFLKMKSQAQSFNK
ncbi:MULTISPECIES: SufE family protein [unclassified Prochlorococcus]|uniref:SufE family protein n=1 Tax=unclassified Prochlorococcus TaxID=2627481 RepID=UPI00053379F7|nr:MULTISPECIES: SufE family protein [unclassified Prochlorococcus]KGG15477.1 Sulfur acceptor protein SufE for iron-sulfur cluster assembly [Prochlorococcus sp. MIT 0602]KGG17757.1 Sulfur acceptor protein SufE for iron-sulfur cluster assembly [Prochlorococcus sp. MIT 0603]